MGVALNLGDRKDVAAAVDALTIPSSGLVADVGFGGGGIGLGDPDAMSGFRPYGFRLRAISEVGQALERARLTVTEHREIGKDSGHFHMLLAAPR
jgi:hypothetical protein